MTLLVAVGADVVLMLALSLFRLRTASAPRRQARRFREGADEARRLALDARIVDAHLGELAELEIERCLRDMGMEVDTDPV